jgi:hypothetical protein
MSVCTEAHRLALVFVRLLSQAQDGVRSTPYETEGYFANSACGWVV